MAQFNIADLFGPSARNMLMQPYTLYRSSLLDENMRLHMASFDTADGDAYNSENCRIAAELFTNQPGVKVRYWREKGPFKK